MWSTERILQVLDDCSEACTFPMLDNGYLYLAATRLSLHRSPSDWAIVIEVFGFSPRAGLPDLYVQTFASQLHDRDPATRYASREAYDEYLHLNPNNEFRSFFPISAGPWQDPDCAEFVAMNAQAIAVRDVMVSLPAPSDLARRGIELEDDPRIRTFELCRWLAATHREDVLARPGERRISVPPELEELLVLDDWNHPDLAAREQPSGSETFQQLARVLASGDTGEYRPSLPGNTHWVHWPEGGTL
jgi:hypothetical protein